MRAVLGGLAAAALLVSGGLVAMACSNGNSDVFVATDDAGPDVDPGDGDVPDTADAADARPDAIPQGEGFCAKVIPVPRFCDDFDDGDLTNQWDRSTDIPPSIQDIDDATYTSPPFSFIAQTTAQVAGGGTNDSLRKTVFGMVAHPTLQFDAEFGTSNITSGLIGIVTLDVSLTHFLRLYLRDGDPTTPGPVLEETVNDTVTRHPLKVLPPTGVWVHVLIDADFDAGTVTVSFGGAKALDAEPITKLVGTEATVRLGAVYVNGPTDPFTIHFDNVLLNF